MKLSHRSRQIKSQRGVAILTVMMMVTVLAVLGVSYMSLSATSSRVSLRGFQKTQATALAEAGVHAMYSQITQSLRAQNGVTQSISPTTLSSTFDNVAVAGGSYSATVISDPLVTTPVLDSNGVTIGLIDTYTITAQGLGTSPDGQTSASVRATFTISEREQDAPGTRGDFTFPSVAVASAGNILLQGNSSTKGTGASVHLAGAAANGVISNNGNAYSVDGPISVPASSLAATTAALGSTPNCFGNAITTLSGPISFPDAATIETWTKTWKSESEEASTANPGGNIMAGPYSPAATTLSVPMEVNGDLDFAKGTTTLQPAAGATSPYILYVHGNVNFPTGNCTVQNNGVLIVCDGVFSMGKNSTYNVSGTTAGGLVSLSTSSNAITITGNATATIGECYAINGGVLVSGNGTLTGSVVSGKTGATGGVSLQGSPTIIYPAGLNNSFAGLPPADNLTIVQQYTPTSPMNWVQTL